VSASAHDEITLFVMPIDEMVFFPTSAVPLNIFEPRYIQMIEESLASNTPVALSFADPVRAPNPKDLQVVVGYGEPTIMIRREDGSMVVQMKGRGKARLRTLKDEGKPYLVAVADKVDEVLEITPPNRFALNRFKSLLGKWLEQNIEDEKQRTLILSNIRATHALLECCAMCLVKDPDARQSFLELDSADERVKFLQKLF
jgi:Lon protease-like protein